jgi:hypothetical protein
LTSRTISTRREFRRSTRRPALLSGRAISPRRTAIDHGDDIDDDGSEDQPKNSVQDIGLQDFELGFETQFQLAHLGAYSAEFGAQFGDFQPDRGAELGEIRSGGQICSGRGSLNRCDHGFRLWIAEPGFPQPLCELQRVDCQRSQPSVPPAARMDYIDVIAAGLRGLGRG